MWEYNIASSMWSQKSNSPVFRQHPGNFAIGTYGYAIGGYSRNGVFKDTYRYAPLQDGWTGIATFPGEARYAPISFSTASYGYIGFGHNAQGSHLDDIWKFEPIYNGNCGTWISVSSYPLQGHFKSINVNATTNYVIGVNCNNDTDLYTNNLDYYNFNSITGSMTNLNINATNAYAMKSLEYLKTGEFAFNLNNHIIVGGGLSKTSEVIITPNPPIEYSQLDYNISYIIPIVYEAPVLKSVGSYSCRICGNGITSTFTTKSYTNISTHTVIQCQTCNTHYSEWYDTAHNATYWVGGYLNNIRNSYVCDGPEYAPIYPEISNNTRYLIDNYVVTYITNMRKIT